MLTLVTLFRSVITAEEKCIPDLDLAKALGKTAEIGFDSAGAVFLLHCVSKLNDGSKCEALRPIIQIIETEYFAGDMNWLNQSSPYAKLLVDCELADPSERSFRELIHRLPTKLKGLLMLGFQSVQTPAHQKAKRTWEEKVEARWKTLDPVDMEEVEREHFLKTNQVLRTSHVEAKPSPMRPGAKLSQALGMEMLRNLPHMSAPDLVVLLGVMGRANRNAVFHRDLKMDAQFAICKRLLELPEEQIGKHVMDICLALSSFESCLEIPSRVWNRKIIPALRGGFIDKKLSADDWALFSASILASGRVRVTNRLGSYLFPFLRERIAEVGFESMGRLLDAFQIAGYVDVQIVALLSGIPDLPPMVQRKLAETREHFRLPSDDRCTPELSGEMGMKSS